MTRAWVVRLALASTGYQRWLFRIRAEDPDAGLMRRTAAAAGRRPRRFYASFAERATRQHNWASWFVPGSASTCVDVEFVSAVAVARWIKVAIVSW